MQLVKELSLIQDSSTRIAILTSALTHTEICELIRYGVNGVLLKEMPTHLIVQCLRSVHAGDRWLERQSMALTLEHILLAEAVYQDMERRLSKRELELARTYALTNAAFYDLKNTCIGLVFIIQTCHGNKTHKNRSRLSPGLIACSTGAVS